jgi:hypothetical protein
MTSRAGSASSPSRSTKLLERRMRIDDLVLIEEP